MPSCRPFFFNDTATTEIYTLSLHDALPIYVGPLKIPETMNLDNAVLLTDVVPTGYQAAEMGGIKKGDTVVVFGAGDWKGTRLNSSHADISYGAFSLDTYTSPTLPSPSTSYC